MVGASKILTVSYGTFSCTLEGFDDSFGTMKAIAEYFRDLASDDRYFGAEPPTPDAEMLQRIAEREIRKRVDAHVEDNGVVLRAASLAAPETVPEEVAPEAAVDAPVAQAPAEAPAAEPVAAPAPVAPPVAAPTAAPETASEPASADLGSVATKLARIRAVVETARAPQPEYGEDNAPEAPATGIPAALLEETSADETGPLPDATPEAPLEDAQPDAAAAALADEELGTVAEHTEADIALDDALISAVAGQAPAEEEIEAEAEETILEDAPQVEEDEDFSLSAIMQAIDETPEEPEAEDETNTSAFDESYEAIELETLEETQDSISETTIEGENSQMSALDGADDTEARQDDAGEDITDSDAAEEVSAHGEDEPEDFAEEEAQAEEEAEEATAKPSREEQINARRARRAKRRAAAENTREPRRGSDQARNAAARARARVLKVKRSDLEEMRAGFDETAQEDDIAQIEGQPPRNDHPPATDINEKAPADAQDDPGEDIILSPEEEADLMAELAEVERDAAPAHDAPNAKRQKPAEPADDAAVSRLVSEVNTKMEGPENRRRRSAIAHLKAAVAATIAERSLRPANREAETEAERTPYREDLASVVRPGTAEPRESRKSGDKMPPLVLVSEQRIDRPAPAPQPSAPVVPRRVNTGNLALQAQDEEDTDTVGNIFFDDDNFADYAERMGATDLPDLLEAAAAYAIEIEGQEFFTRPQVMRVVTEFDGGARFSREDGLRAFGRLLREGKIEKLKRGRFTISQTSSYITDKRG